LCYFGLFNIHRTFIFFFFFYYVHMCSIEIFELLIVLGRSVSKLNTRLRVLVSKLEPFKVGNEVFLSSSHLSSTHCPLSFWAWFMASAQFLWGSLQWHGLPVCSICNSPITKF
jgi:hypothetical protein